MFEGSFVALVTPFTAEGDLHEAALRRLVCMQIDAGTDGIVPCGTTGESAALRGWAERERIIRIVVEEAHGRAKIVPGVGTNSTAETIENVRRLEKLGVDGALVITPYYNKPTQAGLAAHFRAVAQASPVPLILYNVPGRTGVNLLPDTIAALADEPRITAVKEASGSLEQASWIARGCGERITILSGEDAITYPLLCVGAAGVISVTANVVPGDVRALCDAVKRGDHARARELHLRLLPLSRALFLETNPMPAKKALDLLGYEAGPPRLPLVGMQASLAAQLRKVLIEYGLSPAREA
ncbi:MAG: 4-hydroxy-tetrahydrodipicolinate synthase [Candidatus Eisenbacteria bacterium]|nr:4-hydroxy-tetrahydrodipicolinate synthase [Candidatus Eisenbacteria bacterium]